MVTVLMQGETAPRLIGLYACTCNLPIAQITYRLQEGNFSPCLRKENCQAVGKKGVDNRVNVSALRQKKEHES